MACGMDLLQAQGIGDLAAQMWHKHALWEEAATPDGEMPAEVDALRQRGQGSLYWTARWTLGLCLDLLQGQGRAAVRYQARQAAETVEGS